MKSLLHRLLSIAILLSLCLAAWTPAVAADATTKTTVLRIDNKTNKRVDITLTGPRDYTFYQLPGVTEQTIYQGKYRFSYFACGKKFTGTLNVKGKRTKLKIAACPTANLVFINLATYPVYLTLTGPENYNFTISAESAYRMVLLRGSYKWSAYVCGKFDSGSFNLIYKRYRWVFFMPCF